MLATAPHPVERERKESNLHLAVLETAAFPFKLLAHIVDRTGVEPVFAGCKPTVVPLDQRPVGGRGGTQNHNHQLTVDNQFLPAVLQAKLWNRQLLCLLSYTSVVNGAFTKLRGWESDPRPSH